MNITTINWAAALTSLVSMVILYLVKVQINQRFKSKLRIPIPIEIIVVSLGSNNLSFFCLGVFKLIDWTVVLIKKYFFDVWPMQYWIELTSKKLKQSKQKKCIEDEDKNRHPTLPQIYYSYHHKTYEPRRIEMDCKEK